jgi:ubiquinone/menaquinone biosynthesis C-methylase UbiE
VFAFTNTPCSKIVVSICKYVNCAKGNVMNINIGLFSVLKAMSRWPIWHAATKTFASKFYRLFHYQNGYREQKKWAKLFLDSKNDDFSNSWGSVDAYNPGLGDYRIVKKAVQEIALKKTVLELGCLDGKWTQTYHGLANEVILVDLDNSIEPTLKHKFGSNIRFYQTSGKELHGIADDSVDVVFSMDTLVRCRRNIIFSYFREFSRVLKKDGTIYLHLPCDSIEGSLQRLFTPLTLREIENLSIKNSLFDLQIDKTTLEHGVLVKAKKH